MEGRTFISPRPTARCRRYPICSALWSRPLEMGLCHIFKNRFNFSNLLMVCAQMPNQGSLVAMLCLSWNYIFTFFLRLLDALGIRKIWQAFCIGYRPSYLADSAYDNTSEKFPLNPLRTAATANEAIMKQLVST